jgi:hypothetical protein
MLKNLATLLVTQKTPQYFLPYQKHPAKKPHALTRVEDMYVHGYV